MTFLALFGVLRRGSALAAKFLKLAERQRQPRPGATCLRIASMT